MSKRVYDYHQSWKEISKNAGTTTAKEFPEKDGADIQVMVKEDSDEGESHHSDEEKKLCSKSDPYPLTENLYLSTVEAFFLSYGLGWLLVTDKHKKYLNLEEMWSRYSELDRGFVYKYVAYHHFRSKGWVVRSGIKFGVDYLLYKEGPSFYHSSYSVIVKPVSAVNFQPLMGAISQPSSWSALAGINRINEHAAKELMFCYVIQPSEITSDNLKCPTCISSFKIQEQLIKRWVASKEREPETLSD